MKTVLRIGVVTIGLVACLPIGSEAADTPNKEASAPSSNAVGNPKGAVRWFAVPSCDHVAAEAKQPDYIDLIEDEFEKVYPRELGSQGVDKAVIDPTNLKQIVM